MKIVHVCLSMGYTEGLNYQENVIRQETDMMLR